MHNRQTPSHFISFSVSLINFLDDEVSLTFWSHRLCSCSHLHCARWSMRVLVDYIYSFVYFLATCELSIEFKCCYGMGAKAKFSIENLFKSHGQAFHYLLIALLFVSEPSSKITIVLNFYFGQLSRLMVNQTGTCSVSHNRILLSMSFHLSYQTFYPLNTTFEKKSWYGVKGGTVNT